jgi:hypothetical protein
MIASLTELSLLAGGSLWPRPALLALPGMRLGHEAGLTGCRRVLFDVQDGVEMNRADLPAPGTGLVLTPFSRCATSHAHARSTSTSSMGKWYSRRTRALSRWPTVGSS